MANQHTSIADQAGASLQPGNPLNVYKGAASMVEYFDPDCQPPLPLVELPAKLNPFRSDGVRIYAKMATALPAQNIKCLPALNMLLHSPLTKDHIVIEQSSGSTATSLGMLARVLYNNQNTRAYVSNKAGPSRIRQLRFFGITIELYGGPTQPQLSDPRGTVQKAHRLAEGPGDYVNPGQYDNDMNWRSHVRWTGPQLLRQLPEINIFAMAMGSAGCITGTGTYLKAFKPDVKVVGVCFPPKDIIPGPRTLPLVEGCGFPWKEVVDDVRIIGSKEAFRLSMQLCREGLICGPSSGMILQGLLEHVQASKNAGTLHELADPETGEVSCVFICCDLPYQYIDTYFTKLGEEDFPPIINQDLRDVDPDEYDSNWELGEADATSFLAHGVNGRRPTLVDLRSAEDFDKWHLSGAVNTPLSDLDSSTPSPFDDVEVLGSQWKALKAKYDASDFHQALRIDEALRPAVLYCYHGETARLATALLRARGIEAYSVKGGQTASTQT